MSVSTSEAERPVSEVVRGARDTLSPAERKVAEIILADPESVSFGTVAELGRLAGTSGPTVVRLADRLGYDGFVGLQAAVRADLSRRLRPAVARIRTRSGGRVQARVLETEIENLRRTFEGLDDAAFDRSVALLADPKRRISVLPSEQAHGVGLHLANELSVVRDGVRLIYGSEFGVVTRLGQLARRDVVLAIDLRRHERWLLEATALARERGATLLAVTDGDLSPLCDGAEQSLIVAAAGWPFDSHVGVLALANALVAGVAERRRSQVQQRLDTLENAWVESGALVGE